MVVTKESKFVFAGGVRGVARSVSVTVALPVLTQATQTVPGFGPLQELKDTSTSKRTETKERALMRFMWHPKTELSAFAS
jgi:hypothetical protein